MRNFPKKNIFFVKCFSKISLRFFIFRFIHFREKMRNFTKKVSKYERKFSYFFTKRFVRWKSPNFYALLCLKPDGKIFEILKFNSLILQNSNWNIKSLPHQVAKIYSTMSFFQILCLFFPIYFQNDKAFNLKIRIFVNKK